MISAIEIEIGWRLFAIIVIVLFALFAFYENTVSKKKDSIR